MPFRECSPGKLAGRVSTDRRRGIVRLPFSMLLLSGTLLVAGCGEQSSQREERLSALSSTSTERAIGPEERAAAAALAVYTADEPKDQDPYKRALECASSVSATNKKLANSALIGAEELQALAQAEKLFEARVMRIASQGGRSGAEASADLDRARNEALEEGGRTGRTAIACIRALSTESGQAAAPQG